MRSFSFVAVFSMLCPEAALAADDPWGPFNLDGGHITCKNPSGDEIKKFQTYNAPPDRFFKEGSISVQKISGYAPKSNECKITNITKKTIKLNSDAGEIEVDVISNFTVFAGADCGTNPAQYVGKTASIECEVSAKMTKYTNK